MLSEAINALLRCNLVVTAATAFTPKLQRSNALIYCTDHTQKRIENEALLRYATLKCE